MINKIKNKWSNLPLAVKASTAYTISNIVQRSLSFITLPLFTRLLTTEQYGKAPLYASWGSLFAIFLTLNLAWGSFSTAMVKFEDKRDEYISSVQGIFLLLSIIFVIVYIPFNDYWNKLFQLPTFFVMLLVFETIMQNTNLLWLGKKRYEFKYKSVIAFTLLTSVIAPILSFICIILSEEKGWAKILGHSLMTVSFGSIIFILNCIKGKRLFNRKFCKYALGFNIPLIPYYLSQMIFNQSDRIMISHYTGRSDAALYGVAYSLAMVLTFIINAINTSYTPWLYKKIKEGKQEENKTVSCAILFMIALLVLPVIWFAPEIIYIMAGSDYLSAVYVVPPVAISLLLLVLSGFATNILFYYEEKWQLVGASIGAAVLNIVLNAVFIPKYGFAVAGYTTFVSYIAFSGANFLAALYVLKKRKINESGLSIKWLVLILFGCIITGYLGVFLYKYRIPRLVIAIIGVFVILSQYKKGLIFLKRLKNRE